MVKNVKKNSCNCWDNDWKRVVAVVKFLAKRRLTFQDDARYTIAMHLFNPFLADLIQMFGNTGKDNVDYFPSTTCVEFLELLVS